MVKFTYIPLQGIVKRNVNCGENMLYGSWLNTGKNTHKSLLIEGNTLINGLMDRMMKFFKVGIRKERKEKQRLIYSTIWIAKP